MEEHEDLIMDMIYGVEPKGIEAEHYDYEREQVLGKELS